MNHARLNDPTRTDDNVRKLNEIIGETRVAVLTVIDSEGDLHSCPMAVIERAFDGNLWFFTLRNSDKVRSIERSNKVSVSFTNEEDGAYVCLSGHAQLVDDSERTYEFWRPSMKDFFPLGADDPNLALIRVRVTTAEYWESPSSWMKRLLDFAHIASPTVPFLGAPSRPGGMLGAEPA